MEETLMVLGDECHMAVYSRGKPVSACRHCQGCLDTGKPSFEAGVLAEVPTSLEGGWVPLAWALCLSLSGIQDEPPFSSPIVLWVGLMLSQVSTFFSTPPPRHLGSGESCVARGGWSWHPAS